MKKETKIIKRVIYVPPEESDRLKKEAKRSEQAWKRAIDNRDIRPSPHEKKILEDLQRVAKKVLE